MVTERLGVGVAVEVSDLLRVPDSLSDDVRSGEGTWLAESDGERLVELVGPWLVDCEGGALREADPDGVPVKEAEPDWDPDADWVSA